MTLTNFILCCLLSIPVLLIVHGLVFISSTAAAESFDVLQYNKDFLALILDQSDPLNSLFLFRSTCWSRRLAGCYSSPSNTTLTVRRVKEAPQKLKTRWTALCPPLCQRVLAPSCPSPSPLTPTSATWDPALSRKIYITEGNTFLQCKRARGLMTIITWW